MKSNTEYEKTSARKCPVPAPKKIPSNCWENLFEKLYRCQGGICPIAKDKAGLSIHPDCLHHARMPNTKTNRSKYPFVVHSVFNLMAVRNDPWHLRNGRFGQEKGYGWAERLQAFLSQERHFRSRMYVNGYYKRFLNEK